MKVRVSGAALQDIARLRTFLSDQGAPAAQRAAAVIVSAIENLSTFPRLGRASSGNIRELFIPFGQAGYIVRYAVFEDEQEIVILRVWHGRETR